MGPLPTALEALRGDFPRARKGLPRHMLDFDRDAVIQELLEWVGDGRTLSEFCRQPGYPRARTILKWVDRDPAIKAEFETVREVACDVLLGECLDIADDRDARDKDDVKHRKLRIGTRLSVVEKWSKRYGRKINLADADGEKLQFARSDEEITSEISDLVSIGLSRVLAENGNRLN